MAALFRIAALVLAATVLGPVAASTDDNDNAPLSSASTLMPLCGDGTDSAPLGRDFCKSNGYDVLTAQLDEATRAAVSRAPVNVRPLLKRDQAFFNEMAVMEAREIFESEGNDMRKPFDEMLRNRIATMREVGDGFGRNGVRGKWVDAFGSVTVAAADDGAYRVELDRSAIYGLDDDHKWTCGRRGAAVRRSHCREITGQGWRPTCLVIRSRARNWLP